MAGECAVCVCDVACEAPGDFHLATSGWFYGIWICLLLILIILILLIVAKKYTDKNWEEKGIVLFLPLASNQLATCYHFVSY